LIQYKNYPEAKISETLLKLRKLISVESNANANLCVKLGLAPILNEFLNFPFDSIIFRESSRIFNNLAASNHENVLILLKEGIHLKVTKYLQVPNFKTIEDVFSDNPMKNSVYGQFLIFPGIQ